MSGANGATRVAAGPRIELQGKPGRAGEEAGEARPLLAAASLTKHFPLKSGLFN